MLLYHACPCTMQVYLHLHLLYCHLHITMCQHLWTMCEHLCEHPSTNCFFKCYCTMHVHAQCKFIYIYIYYTATCILPCVTICEQCVNTCVDIHLPIVSLNAIVPCMSMHNASLSTSTSTTLPLAYHHVSPSVNTAVWTCICKVFLETHMTLYVYL